MIYAPIDSGASIEIDVPGVNWDLAFVVEGEPASKANSRRAIIRSGKPRVIKSKKAMAYLTAFEAQCPTLDPLLDGDLVVAMRIYYATRRPDLDESLILDAMQKRVYANDRQVKEKHIHWALDRDAPRAVIQIGERKDPRTTFSSSGGQDAMSYTGQNKMSG